MWHSMWHLIQTNDSLSAVWAFVKLPEILYQNRMETLYNKYYARNKEPSLKEPLIGCGTSTG